MRISDWSSDVCSSDRRQRPGEPSIEMHQRGSYLVRHLVRGFAISLDQPFLPRNRRHAMRGQLVDLVPFTRSARWGQAPLFWIAKGIVDPLYPPVQPSGGKAANAAERRH